MGPLHTLSAPPPSVSVTGDLTPAANAYFALGIDAAASLAEAPGYRNRPRSEQVARARAEQLRFLTAFLDPGLRAALDLRIAADPAAPTPLSAALVGRVWDSQADAAAERALQLRDQVRAAVPRYVAATPVEDADAVAQLLSPLRGTPVDSAVITRRELIARPSRPDAGVSYYYSAVPFSQADSDWSAVYTALAASPVPAVLSVALLPVPVPAQFSRTLQTLAGFYGRLAREGDVLSGPFRGGPAGSHRGGRPGAPFLAGSPRLAPDPFAVEAEKAFRDYDSRLAGQAFALRIQVSAARRLPPGLVEAIAAAVSPGAACEVRRPDSAAERRLAEYNLNVVNVAMLAGRRDIWGRPDPPDSQLALLTVLGDARDAGCAFRFPIAAGVADTAPRPAAGHPARPGPSPASGPDPVSGPSVRLGRVSDDSRVSDPSCVSDESRVSDPSREVSVSLRSLTGATLIAGAAGSGKSTTTAQLLRQLWTEHQIPFLVIDPAGAGDYRKLAAEHGFTALEVVTAGDEAGAPLRLSPFAVPPGTTVGGHTADLLSCFTAALGLAGPAAQAYRDALSLTYRRAGLLAAERPGERTDEASRAWPTVTDFLAALDEVAGPGVTRPGWLARGPAASVLLTSGAGGIAGLLDHPVVVELGALAPGDEQALVTALLLNAVAQHGQAARGPSGELAHLTVVAEAGRLLGGGAAEPGRRPADQPAAALAARLADSRRHGEGLLFTEQFPARLLPDLVKSTRLQIMHRLVARDDLRHLGQVMGLDQAQHEAAARLRPGEALLRGAELGDVLRAVLTPPSPDLPGSTVPPTTIPLTTVPLTTVPPTTVPLTTVPPTTARPAAGVAPPFAGCGQCRARCAYRGAALSLLDDPRTVVGITAAARPGLPAEAVTAVGTAAVTAVGAAAVTAVTAVLYETVDRFAALPAADPGRSDAAFCLFLHAHATSSLRSDPEWPAAAARGLGITGQRSR
jgi:hypothetical protein